jgi:LuxR family maltose regulon positive regulatory protein
LTIIAAPAGSGKTSLLVDWLSEQDSTTRVAWLALDAADSDPAQFLRYLIAALQTIDPRVGAHVLSLIEMAQGARLEAVLPMLINELSILREQIVLVLDDYHVIDSPIVHQMLQFLLEHLPPRVHLVIASRVDPPLPLPRLRVRGQLSELRAHDLRFTPAEAATFLRDTMHLSLSPEDVAALEMRTEGWIAGLQMAALSLQHRPREQTAAFIEAFAGSNRFVVDYLVEEVLARQPAHVQTFLLQTSILERLSGPLCDAVVLGDTDTEDQAYSQLLLDQFERSNLFLVPLSDDRRWYRYHHLFAQALRERLGRGVGFERVAALHRRASAWFEQQGYLVEAVYHALEAKDWEHVACLIDGEGRYLLVRGQVQTVLDWLHALPQAFVQTRPSLIVTHAAALFCVNRLDAAEHTATSLLSLDFQDERARTLGIAIGIRAYVAYFRGDLERWQHLSAQSLQVLQDTEATSRDFAQLHLAANFLLSGDVTTANERQLTKAVEVVRASSDLLTHFHAIVCLAEFRRRQGQLHQAAKTYSEVFDVAPELGGLEVLLNGAAYYFGFGVIQWEWNNQNDAEILLAQGRDLVCRGALVAAEAVAQGYLALAWLYQARGESTTAVSILDELDVLARDRSFAPHLNSRVSAARARLALMRGNGESALEWIDTCNFQQGDTLTYVHEFEYLAFVRVRIAQAQRTAAPEHAADAVQLLEALHQAAEANGRVDSVIEIVALRALALQAQGNISAALANLERAIRLALLEGYVRVFVNEGAAMAELLVKALNRQEWGRAEHGQSYDIRGYARQLLAAFEAEGIIATSSLHVVSADRSATHIDIDAMTERELEVLRLLALGHSNQAIAQQLVVTVGTVKRHVNSILSKLGVQSRLQAVARARERNLV